MTFLTPQTGLSSRSFIPASLSLIVCIFLSVLHVNLPGGSVSLLLLPLLIVSLWPRGVNPVVTIVTFFVMGMFMDWGTNGALGQWAIIYLSVFIGLRPDRRDGRVSFLGAIGLWGVGLAIGALMIVITGWLVYATLPNFTVLFRQALLISIMMPLAVFIRNIVRLLLTDPQDRDYL